MSEIYPRAKLSRVAFVGLGMMGLPMLENLATHSSLHLVAFDSSPAPFGTLEQHSAWKRSLDRATSLEDQCGDRR
jgi:3-hydroxyisobutyrate dehydrogenase